MVDCPKVAGPSVLVSQYVPGLAFQDAADRVEGREPHRLRAAILQHRDVRRGDSNCFREVADVISHALRPGTDDAALAELRARVDVLADRFPLYPNLTEASL